MADDPKTTPAYDSQEDIEEAPEITGVHAITRGNIQKRLAQSESGVPVL